MKRAYAFIFIFCILFSGCSMQDMSTAGESFKEYLEQKDNSSSNELAGKDENNNDQAYSGENIQEAKDSGIPISDNDKSIVKDKKAGDAFEILDYKKAADVEMEKIEKIDEELYKIRKSLKFNQYTMVKINNENYAMGNGSKKYESKEDLKKDFPFINPLDSFDNYKLESIFVSLKYPYDLVRIEPGKIVDGPELSNASIGQLFMTYKSKDNADSKFDLVMYIQNTPTGYYVNNKKEEVEYKNQKYYINFENESDKIQIIEFTSNFQGTVAYCIIRKYKFPMNENHGNNGYQSNVVIAPGPDWFDNSKETSISFVNTLRESIDRLFVK